MKGKTLKTITLSVLLFLFVLPAISQRSRIPVYGTIGDSASCGGLLSAYRTFYKLELYEYAYETWAKAFNNCPGSSERMYLDGVVMYRYFIEAATGESVREGRIDTLMLIYDRRMEYFGDEGNVLGRKGRDLLTYRRTDIEQVQKAYEMLKTSIELQGPKSQESVMLYFISAGLRLSKAGKIDDNQVIEDYITTIKILVQQDQRSSSWKRTRAKIDEIMHMEDILSCEAFNRYYEPLFEQNKNDPAFLEQLIAIYTASGCDRSNIYIAALENLYRIEPGPESAHNLAILFIIRNESEKAAAYLKEAVQGENIDRDTRAGWYYKLAVVSNANKDYCEAIDYAREATRLKSNYGKAYILLGDAYVASRDKLGDDFQQRTAYWAAADMYKKAASADPSVAEESRQKLTEYADQYPSSEDIFFLDKKDGDPYLVGGCINENTTIRSRK